MPVHGHCKPHPKGGGPWKMSWEITQQQISKQLYVFFCDGGFSRGSNIWYIYMQSCDGQAEGFWHFAWKCLYQYSLAIMFHSTSFQMVNEFKRLACFNLGYLFKIHRDKGWLPREIPMFFRVFEVTGWVDGLEWSSKMKNTTASFT